MPRGETKGKPLADPGHFSSDSFRWLSSFIFVFIIKRAQGCYANYTGVNLLFIMPLILLLFQQAEDGVVKTHLRIC